MRPILIESLNPTVSDDVADASSVPLMNNLIELPLLVTAKLYQVLDESVELPTARILPPDASKSNLNLPEFKTNNSHWPSSGDEKGH